MNRKEIMKNRADKDKGQITMRIGDRYINKTPRKYDNRLFVKHSNKVFEISQNDDIYVLAEDYTHRSVNGTGLKGHEIFW